MIEIFSTDEVNADINASDDPDLMGPNTRVVFHAEYIIQADYQSNWNTNMNTDECSDDEAQAISEISTPLSSHRTNSVSAETFFGPMISNNTKRIIVHFHILNKRTTKNVIRSISTAGKKLLGIFPCRDTSAAFYFNGWAVTWLR